MSGNPFQTLYTLTIGGPKPKIQTLLVGDPFRSAYLLLFGRYRETLFDEGRRFYMIEGVGQTLATENYRYRTGYAL